MKPQISSDGNLFRTVTPFILRTRAPERFALTAEHFCNVCLPRLFFLLFCKMNIFRCQFLSSYTQFIKDQFEACIGNIKRPSDIVKPRPKEKKKKVEK